jgi:hypothetical protein
MTEATEAPDPWVAIIREWLEVWNEPYIPGGKPFQNKDNDMDPEDILQEALGVPDHEYTYHNGYKRRLKTVMATLGYHVKRVKTCRHGAKTRQKYVLDTP